jgi:ABC-type multidrug transport system permease subunit
MTFFSLLLSPSIYSLELQNTFVIQINIENTEAKIKHGIVFETSLTIVYQSITLFWGVFFFVSKITKNKVEYMYVISFPLTHKRKMNHLRKFT